MALTYDQVSAITHALINESIADNIYASNPLFMWLFEKGKVVEDGGLHIQLPIDYKAIGAVGTFSKYSILDTTPTDNFTAAKWLWKYYYGQVIVSDTELWENSGKSQAVNLLKSKTRSAMMSLKDTLGTDAFSTNGDSSLGLNGLRQTVKASGLAGGIDSADFAGWAANIDSSTANLTLATMDTLFLNCSVGSEEPDIIVTHKNEFAKYRALLQANQRFGASEVGAGNFRYLLFNSVPMFHDSHCPGAGATKHMFMLNSNWVYLYANKNCNFKVEKIGKIPSQAVYVDRIVFGGNIATDNRRLLGAFTVLND